MARRIIPNEDLVAIYECFDDLRHLASWHGEVTKERSEKISRLQQQVGVIQLLLESILPEGALTSRFEIVNCREDFLPHWKEGSVFDENGNEIPYSTIFKLISFAVFCGDMLNIDGFSDIFAFERRVFSFEILFQNIINQEFREIVNKIVCFV